MFYMPFDTLYLFLVLPAFVFSIWAQFRVTGSFKKYSKQLTKNRITGAEAAREILRQSGIDDVRVERVGGNLSDHFDPKTNVIRLSENVYDTPSVAAVGVAAHEAGHAVQYAGGYAPIKIRAAIIPVTNIGSKLAIPLILIGLFTNLTGFINIGIILFGTIVVFQLITLPVEFNASRRAVKILGESGILAGDELPASNTVPQLKTIQDPISAGDAFNGLV